MKKTIFLMVLIFVLQSCSSSIYYAYENDDDYCTLEITKKNDVIYRAVSINHYNKTGPKHASGSWDDTSPEFSADNIYIYIYSTDSTVEEFISIDSWFDMYLIKVGSNNQFEFCNYNLDNDYYDSMFTYEKEVKDSLDLLWAPSIKENLLKEACFRENAITWFPPYMKRVKKIDYKKFNLPQIKTKHLKNPKNAPKVSD